MQRSEIRDPRGRGPRRSIRALAGHDHPRGQGGAERKPMPLQDFPPSPAAAEHFETTDQHHRNET
jgi:hypothetical protein